MQRTRAFFFSAILLLLSIAAYAQNGLNGTYTCVVMQEKKYIGGIGLKVGAPMAVTYKMYFLKRFAFEVAAGLSNTSVSEQQIVDNFLEETKMEYEGREIADFGYFMHSVEGVYAAQARMMMHNPIPRALSSRGFENLDWYIGIGAVMRIIDVKYLYEYKPDPNRSDIKSFNQRLLEYGPEVMLGFEYAFKEIPLAAFAEMGAFIRVNNKEDFHAIQGGLGVRYNF